jgi:hypothetical protein
MDSRRFGHPPPLFHFACNLRISLLIVIYNLTCAQTVALAAASTAGFAD